MYRLCYCKNEYRCGNQCSIILLQNSHIADSRFAPSQWEAALHCNEAWHWLGARLESTLSQYKILIMYTDEDKESVIFHSSSLVSIRWKVIILHNMYERGLYSVPVLNIQCSTFLALLWFQHHFINGYMDIWLNSFILVIADKVHFT